MPETIQKTQKDKFLALNQETVTMLTNDMPLEEEIYDVADLFKMLSDSTRLSILCMLFKTEMCVYDIASILNMTQSAISHQLRVLKHCKLVKNRRQGKTIFYSLADEHVRTIINNGFEHIEE